MKDGGPALPTIDFMLADDDLRQLRVVYKDGGMTMRQWYAGMALQGLFSTITQADMGNKTPAEFSERMAKASFVIADAMIAHEEKKR